MTGEKKVNGRKRQFWVDTNGFLLRVLVHPADISDTEGAEWLLAAHHHAFPRMQEIRVDEGYKQGLDKWLQQNTAIRLNIIEKPPGQKDLPSFRSDGWWNARLRGRDATVWRVKNTTAIQNQAKPFFYLGSIAMLLNRLYPRC
jgi:putative transposase